MQEVTLADCLIAPKRRNIVCSDNTLRLILCPWP